MSQHYYKTLYKDKLVLVFIGWDSPAQGFFMDITELPTGRYGIALSTKDPAHEPVYVYASDQDDSLPNFGFPKTLNPFLTVLWKLNIVLPQSIIQIVLADSQDITRTNRHVFHPSKHG